jgi:hypothetical protein
MPKQWSAEEAFDWIVDKTIWFFLPFYAMWRLTKDLIEEIRKP